MDPKENMCISIDFDFSKFKFNGGLDDKLLFDYIERSITNI